MDTSMETDAEIRQSEQKAVETVNGVETETMSLASRLDEPLDDPGIPVKRYINTFAKSEKHATDVTEEQISSVPEPIQETILDAGPIPEAYDMQLDMPSTPLEPLRPEAVYLYGTDKMSTEDVLKYASDLGPPPGHLEWIDDSSCVLVYETEQDATGGVVALSASTFQPLQDEGWKLQVRRAKAMPSHPETLLSIRVATLGDIKRKGAASKSRWYERHGRSGRAPPHRSTPYDRPPRRRPESYRGKELFPNGKARQISPERREPQRQRLAGRLYMDMVEETRKKPSEDGHGRSQVSYEEALADGPRDALAERIEKRRLADRLTATLRDRL